MEYTYMCVQTHTDIHCKTRIIQKGEKVIDLNKIKQTISMEPSKVLKKLTNVQPNILK